MMRTTGERLATVDRRGRPRNTSMRSIWLMSIDDRS
jgi:hypothetical protein